MFWVVIFEMVGGGGYCLVVFCVLSWVLLMCFCGLGFE